MTLTCGQAASPTDRVSAAGHADGVVAWPPRVAALEQLFFKCFLGVVIGQAQLEASDRSCPWGET